MNVVLWVLQALLAATFLASGALKALLPADVVRRRGHPSLQRYPFPFVRFIGWAELLGAAGVILPWVLGVAPILTPLAAAGLGLILLGAARAHATLAREDPPHRRRELTNLAGTLFLLAACALVAVERFRGLAPPGRS